MSASRTPAIRRFSNSLYRPTAANADPVVDLADLVQRGERFSATNRMPSAYCSDDRAAAAGDALAGEVGPVPHQLLG